MLLTPFSSSITQFKTNDTIDTNSLGILLLGANGVSGQAKIIKVTDNNRLVIDGSEVKNPSLDVGGNIQVGSTILSDVDVAINTAASADLVAAITSKIISVLSMWFIVAADTTVKFQTNGSSDLTGAMTIKSGSGIVLPYNKHGWLKTGSGQKLNIILGTATQISGSLKYAAI